MRILVTGATGFIGGHLCRRLAELGHRVRAATRRSGAPLCGAAERITLGDLSDRVDWEPALHDVDAVVHLAGLAHRVSSDDVDAYDRVNHQATRALARTVAQTRGVRKFVFLSSVAAHGTPANFPLRSTDSLEPDTPYGRSKRDAELAIREALDPALVDWAILRPVLVYGRDNPGNMARLQQLLRRHVPVPVTTAPNRRSVAFVGNLVDVIVTFLHRDRAPAGRTWIVADAEVVSTEELVKMIGKAMHLHSRTVRVSDRVLDFTARMGTLAAKAGLRVPWNEDVRRKLLGDFWVDISDVKRELGWAPRYAVREGIAASFGDSDGADGARRGA